MPRELERIQSLRRAAFVVATLAATACGQILGLDGIQYDVTDAGTLHGDAAAPIDAPDDAVVTPGEDAAADVDAAGETSIDAAGDASIDAPIDVAPPEFAWYKLTETSGNVAHDSTANGYDVSLLNVSWDAGANFALSGADAGSGGVVTVGAGLRQAPVSFAAWLTPAARADEATNAHGLTPYPPGAISGDVPGQFGFGIGLDVWTDGGSALAVENVGYTFTNAGGAPFVAGDTYFVVVAIGGASASIYVDAALVATASVSTPGAAPTTTLSLGVHNGDTGYGTKRFYAGRMRDARVYKRALTAAEVAALYGAGPAP